MGAWTTHRWVVRAQAIGTCVVLVAALGVLAVRDRPSDERVTITDVAVQAQAVRRPMVVVLDAAYVGETEPGVYTLAMATGPSSSAADTTAPPTTVSPTTVPPTTVPPPTVPPTTVPPTTAPPTTAPPPPPTTAPPPPPTTEASPPAESQPANSQEGKASWYRHTAGTCAHRTLPFDTIVTVTNLDNGKQATCRVADRGPFVEGRIIDLERGVFAELAPPSQGVIRVRIEW